MNIPIPYAATTTEHYTTGIPTRAGITSIPQVLLVLLVYHRYHSAVVLLVLLITITTASALGVLSQFPSDHRVNQ